MNKSENEDVKEIKPKTGFGFRIAQAIINTVVLVALLLFFLYQHAIGVNSPPEEDSPYMSDTTVLILTTVVLCIVAIISFAVAIVGKKHRWANWFSVVLNALYCCGGIYVAIAFIVIQRGFNQFWIGLCVEPLFVLLSIWGIIGGVKGLRAIPKKVRVKEEVQTSDTVKNESVLTDGQQNDQSGSSVQSQPQGVQSELKEPKKGWVLFGVMTAYYLFLLVFGILSMVMPEKGLAWGPYDNMDYTVAMNVITGFILILLVPSYGYYLACKAPFRIGKKGSIIIFALSIVLTVIGDVLFYILMGEHLSFVSFTMKFAPVLAEVGIIAIYVMGFFRTVTEKQADSQDAQGGNTKGGFANVISKILRCSNSAWFIFGGTVLFSLCLFVLIELLYALLCIAIILFIVALFRSFTVGSSGHGNVYYVTDDTGSTRTLHYDRYNSFSGEDIYKDDVGGEWATKDGGSTFYSI